MKLTNAQQEVMDDAIRQIDTARALDYMEWLHNQATAIRDLDDAVAREYLKEYWEKHREGLALTHCSSATLRNLEKRGLIEIIRDSAGERYGLDWVKVLNY